MSIRILDGKLLLVDGKASINDECCCGPEMISGTCCDDGSGEIPRYLTVELSGITKCGTDGSFCYHKDVELVNGTYVCEHWQGCAWLWEPSSPVLCCTYGGRNYYYYHFAGVGWSGISNEWTVIAGNRCVIHSTPSLPSGNLWSTLYYTFSNAFRGSYSPSGDICSGFTVSNARVCGSSTAKIYGETGIASVTMGA